MIQIHRGQLMTKLQPVSLTSSRLTGCQPPTRGDSTDEIPRDLYVTPGSVGRSSKARRGRGPCHSDPGSKAVTSAMAVGCLSAMLLGRD
jgi:hypothetical protein